MPGLNPLKIIGNLKFMAAGLKLPTSASWRQPSGDPAAAHYGEALQPHERVALPRLPPPWFTPQNRHKYHQQSCDDIGEEFKKLHDGMIDAVQFAHNMWRFQAKFQNLKVMALSAIGTPGCLDGPSLQSGIKTAPSCAAFTGNRAKYRDAVAKGVSTAFKSWQDNVMVPGLPWYPAFVAFPGPQAPPMPNVPTPLIACTSSRLSDITAPDTMKREMIGALDSELKDSDPDKQHEALFDAIATVLALAFLMWLPMQQVMLVLGKGPIPTFAPPLVPAGPVVSGDNIAVSGHLMV